MDFDYLERQPLVGISLRTMKEHLGLMYRYQEDLTALRETYKRVAWGKAPEGANILPSEVQRLLDTPVMDLQLDDIGGSLAVVLSNVKSELNYSGISWFPQIVLGEGGVFNPWQTTLIVLPWYLANPAVWWLVNDQTSQFTADDMQMMMRHEVAHPLSVAFKLIEREDWRAVFGDPDQPYREEYVPDEDPTNFVHHMDQGTGWRNIHYPQKHPEEDWAETFAVWITQGRDWRAEYPVGTGARRKLDYVENLVASEMALTGPPLVERIPPFIPESYKNITLTPREIIDKDTGWGNHAALLRREPFLYNAVHLHKTYFEQLRNGAGAQGPGERIKALAESMFGSVDAWLMDFRQACAGANGWALACLVNEDGPTLNNFLVNGHTDGIPIDAQVILACDVWEHAYFGDYATRKDLYVGAFFRNLDWDVCEARAAAVLAPRVVDAG